MAESVLSMSTPDRNALSTPLPKSISLKTQQEIKSAVHQELIKRMDLEKLPFIQENRAAQQQLLLLIHQTDR